MYVLCIHFLVYFLFLRKGNSLVRPVCYLCVCVCVCVRVCARACACVRACVSLLQFIFNFSIDLHEI